MGSDHGILCSSVYTQQDIAMDEPDSNSTMCKFIINAIEQRKI